MTADTTMEITLPVGRVRGVRRHGWSEFRGIPYAAPPVGTRRFRSPQPHGAWSDVLDATRFGPVCPQEFDAIDAAMGADDQPQSEAGCLTLSVWRPEQAASGSGLPVMVWIHGGALSSGASSWPQYDGRAFARDGIVFVGVNYRLHALGFLDFGRFGADDGRPTTNLGLQDAELALRWVRANIAAFGGDPENITIFGESAGGAMVNGLVASPTARGLFRRAVMQSGTCVRLIEHEAAGQITRNACRLLGVAPDDRAALQAVPVRELVGLVGIPGLLEGVDTPVTFPWLFTRDPAGLDLDGLEAVDAGRADGLELILGWTADEYRLRRLTRAPDGLPEDLSPLGDLTGALLAAHARHRPELDPVELSEAVLNHQHFYAPALRIADAHARRGGSVHLYEFRWRSPVLGGRLGSCHALEIPFVFDRAVAPAFHGPLPLPARLVEVMHGSWAAFARDGNPSVPGLVWPAHRPGSRFTAVFDTDSRVVEDLHPDLAALWERARPEQIGIQ